jgi:Ca2+-transporting ATPase
MTCSSYCKAFIFAVHVPIAGLTMPPPFFGLPILFGSIHIAFIEMVTDLVCALVFEAEREEANIMQRKPRTPAEPMFSSQMIVCGMFQGLLGFIMIAAVFLIESHIAMPEKELRALGVFALITEIIALIFVNRSFSNSLSKTFMHGNKALRYVHAAIIVITGLILTRPVIQWQLKFGSFAWQYMILALGFGLLLLLILKICKPLAKRLILNKPAQQG